MAQIIKQKQLSIFFFSLFFVGVYILPATIWAQKSWEHGRLKVASNGQSLAFEDGHPFFWLGDTGWELFHRLTVDEISRYLDNRAAKGFNVIQAVALAEFDGLTKPNHYGQTPLVNNDPAHPNETYFGLLDTVIRMAEQKNMFIGLLPTWGDKVTLAWGTGPVIFDSLNAYRYGRWIGNRYRNRPNIIWILGGDRPAKNDKNDWTAVWRAMAQGIKDGTDNRCFITYHPSGGNYSTSQFIQTESWLDMNMFQSGHGGGHDVACWELVKRDLSYRPVKPTLDAEPNYEDHPVNPWPKWNTDSGYYRAYDVRKQLYRSVFAGACGVTYGHHAVWQFMSAYEEAVNYPDRGWINAMDRPGAFQAGYLKKLMESRPFVNRIADPSLILDSPGVKGEHIESFRARDNSYAMIYLPVGRTIHLNPAFLNKRKINGWWYDPGTGKSSALENIDLNTSVLTSPTIGLQHDWVLVLDDAGFNFPALGMGNYYDEEHTNKKKK
jgi:Protein of unknown function (DUF4038)/Putative collagen-binding domain of a collagenase